MNRLSYAQSLYLRKHAENPIDWWTWCDEALETAKRKNLPIFLSIGYSSCHWCTVMEGEAFSDQTIAAYMNANFLPIKVDREERPALDSMGICQQRGLDLFLGGIFDHVGGGFHRYTVDPTWTVPHFEKMLYDNGQIVEYLADLWSTGMQEPALERAITQTIAWLKREMTASQGYFYAAQDADSFVTPEDSEPEEGAFYIWSYAELEQHLTPDELQALTEQFTVTPAGNVVEATAPQQTGKNVLTALSLR